MKKKINFTEDSFLTIDIFSSVISIIICFFSFYITYPFDNIYPLIFRILCLSFFIINLPFFLKRITIGHSVGNNRIFQYLFLSSTSSIFIVFFLAIVIYLIPLSIYIILPIIIVLGILSFIYSSCIFIKNQKLWRNIVFLVITTIIGAWVATTYISSDIQGNCGDLCTIYPVNANQALWHNPLLNQWLMIEKDPISTEVMFDQFMHASIMNMIKTYDVPSLGVNGLIYLPYHYGSHWIFAQISKVLEIDGIKFYQVAFPAIFITLFFKTILSLSIYIRIYYLNKLKDQILRTDVVYWFIFFIYFINIIPYNLFQAIVPWWHKIPILFNSESYLLSLIILGGTIVTFLTASDPLSNNNRSIRPNLLFCLSIPIIILAMSIIKISTGLILLITILYFLIRLRLYKFSLVNIIFLLSVLAYYFVSYITTDHGTSQTTMVAHPKLEIFAFLKYSVGKNWQPYFYILNSFGSIFFVFMKFIELQITTPTKFIDAYKNKQIMDVELIAVMCISGIIPGLLINFPSGNAYYFSDIQTWVTLPFILANLPNFLQYFRSKLNV